MVPMTTVVIKNSASSPACPEVLPFDGRKTPWLASSVAFVLGGNALQNIQDTCHNFPGID